MKTWQQRIRMLPRQKRRGGLWDVSREAMAPDTLKPVRANMASARRLPPSAGRLTALTLQAR